MKRKIIKNIPEFFLLLSTIFYWLSAGLAINPIAIIFILAISAQMYFRRKETGIALSLIFCALFSYLFLALLSDIVKYDDISGKWHFVIGVSTYLGLSLGIAIWMLVNYLKTSYNKETFASK